MSAACVEAAPKNIKQQRLKIVLTLTELDFGFIIQTSRCFSVERCSGAGSFLFELAKTNYLPGFNDKSVDVATIY